MIELDINKPITPEKWGKDHWSLLGYVASCFDGEIDRRRLRCNPDRHPFTDQAGWQDSYSTRLQDQTETALGHDDWDCLNDLEDAGMVEVLSAVNGMVWLTELGSAVAFQLRTHKCNGGTFATFSLKAK